MKDKKQLESLVGSRIWSAAHMHRLRPAVSVGLLTELEKQVLWQIYSNVLDAVQTERLLRERVSAR